MASNRNLIAMASNLLAMASNRIAMASNLIAMASNLIAMASNVNNGGIDEAHYIFIATTIISPRILISSLSTSGMSYK